MTSKENLLEIISPYTILSKERKNGLYDCAENVLKNKTAGDFVECGVFKGGSAGILAGLMLQNNSEKNLWLFDSFCGLPKPGEDDVSIDGDVLRGGECYGSEVKVNELILKKLKFSQDNLKIIKGWYNDTIPKETDKIKSICLLHLDCD